MRNKVAKQLRKIAKQRVTNDTTYEELTYHNVNFGFAGRKNIAQIVNPIKLSFCTRKLYKEYKKQYASHNNI